MANYKIITDSACDLPVQLQQQLSISVVSLHVLFQGENKPDTVETEAITRFYAGMRDGAVGKTSAANPEGWTVAMEQALKDGLDVLALGFSSGLSTTYQSAVIAAADLQEKYPDRKIIVVDTLSAALGQGLLVWYACKKRDEGLSLEELAAWVEENKDHLVHWFTVDDLVYLKRGGRISAATAVVGTVLNIKPVLHVDNDGRLVSVVKARGRKAAIKALSDKLDAAGNYDNSTVFICHADCMDDALKLKEIVLKNHPGTEVYIGNLGAVIGSHAGPGTLALFFMGEER